MTATLVAGQRAAALERAEANAPFLRGAASAFPKIAAAFLEDGSDTAVAMALAIDGETPSERLRRQRHALALATALADLSGERPLEWVTATLSDFADAAMDEALRTVMLERLPDEEPRGLAIIALGKLGSHELNYSSDVDLILLFDPDTLPRRPRDEPGEAAVRYGRRFI
jgi:[glutamine synthetase] adenylyltransferase / [glutamine synthetase]-adenylyl-L-tyrosine phosphorylase